MLGSPKHRLSNETQDKTSGAVAVEDTVKIIAAISTAWSRRNSGIFNAVEYRPRIDSGTSAHISRIIMLGLQ
jgi:hypothetical protein